MAPPNDTPPAPNLAIDVAGLSREGRRASNEDSAAWVAYGPGSSVAGYVVVCDGMGGHNAGEVASSMALRLLQTRIGELASEPYTPGDPAALASRVGAWISEINLAIHRGAASNAEHAGMGTTLALALEMSDGRLVVANVGDSKVFLVRGVVVQQLSVDHTALAEQRRILNKDSGSALDDAANPFFHALTRSLGQEAEVAPDILADVVMRPGDLVVVTSDGVTDVLESERFLSIVEGSQNLTEVAETTYRLAFAAGSKDNITVALLANGRPVRLGSATPSQGDVDLDGTIPMARVRPVPQPVSGGTAMADGGRPAAAGPEPSRAGLGLRTPVLIGAAAILGCAAALVVWLTGGPSSQPEAASGPMPAPTAPAAGPGLPPGERPSAPFSPPTAVPNPTAVPGSSRDEYTVAGGEPASPVETPKATGGLTVVRVPSTTPRADPRLAPPPLVMSVPTAHPSSSPAVPAPAAATPAAARPTERPAAPPTPRATERPAAPEPTVAIVAPHSDETSLAVPGVEARLVAAWVRVLRKRNRYRFEFEFERGVREPPRANLEGDSIRVRKIQVRSRNVALGDQNVRGWDGYPLRYVRGLGTDRRLATLSFDLLDNKTNFAGDKSLKDGDQLELDLSGLDWLFGAGTRTIVAPVFAGAE